MPPLWQIDLHLGGAADVGLDTRAGDALAVLQLQRRSQFGICDDRAPRDRVYVVPIALDAIAHGVEIYATAGVPDKFIKPMASGEKFFLVIM